MIKITVSVILLFIGSVMCIFAGGNSEAQHRRDLAQYGIEVSPISLSGTRAYDFVYINANKIIITEPRQLIEINPTTGERKIIELPEDWVERRFEGFRELTYDEMSNSVHVLFRERRLERIGLSYNILCLEDYTWEAIEELGYRIQNYWYDSENMKIYTYQFELESEGGYIVRSIKSFDLSERKFIDSIEIPYDIRNIYCIYGNPLKILADVRIENSYSTHFIIFDIATGTRIDFSESFIDNNTGFFHLSYYTPLDNDMQFIGVERRMSNRSGIVMMDLNANSMETVALDGFPYEIYNFKKIAEGRYGFMVGTRTWTGGHGQSFLCFLDYPQCREIQK